MVYSHQLLAIIININIIEHIQITLLKFNILYKLISNNSVVLSLFLIVHKSYKDTTQFTKYIKYLLHCNFNKTIRYL